MSGFLAFIAKRYGRKAEDIATDVVTYLMRETDVQFRIALFLAELGFPYLESGFFAETRSSGKNGIPDIKLFDRQGKCRVIVENKFWALLTSKQPCAYLNELSKQGLVLFVVPKSRRKSIWEQVCTRCEKVDGPIVAPSITRLGCIGRTGQKFIAVITWNTLLNELAPCTYGISAGSSISDNELFINELRRLCNVEETKGVENLDAKIVSSKAIGLAVFNYMKLLAQIIDAATDAGYIKRVRRKLDSYGEGYHGEWGQLGPYRAWIGLEARLWSERGESPIWIVFSDEKIIDKKLRAIFLAARGRWSWLDDPRQLEDGNLGGERQLVIPIPIKPRVHYDSVLQGAIERIEQIKSLFESRRLKKA